jgi:ectoine hydroxylase-related dioxygenase (phytanoyl-CoA dioxygenase family)
MGFIADGFRYDEQAHEHYQRLGYCIFGQFLSQEGLARCRRELDRVMAGLRPGKPPEETVAVHQFERWLFDLATEGKILDMIERQVGPDIVLWSTHLLCKPPRTGQDIPWHQDAPYWNISGRLSGGVWIPVDDIGEDNGAMAILPGWHEHGVLPRKHSGKEFFHQEIDPASLPADREDTKVRYLLQAGQMAIHHPMMVHNSVQNGSTRWRRVIIMRYMAADGEMGAKDYDHYATGAVIPRTYYLVRGRDLLGRGLRRTPDVAQPQAEVHAKAEAKAQAKAELR